MKLKTDKHGANKASKMCGVCKENGEDKHLSRVRKENRDAGIKKKNSRAGAKRQAIRAGILMD